MWFMASLPGNGMCMTTDCMLTLFPLIPTVCGGTGDLIILTAEAGG